MSVGACKMVAEISLILAILNQCDQALKDKVAQNFSNVAQNIAMRVFTWKWMFSKQPKKFTHILAIFVRKFVN